MSGSGLAPGPAGGYRVTAIVSTFRSARFMAGCLEDLVGQTLHQRGELEIVVVDTGSPEDEGRIVREWQARTPHLRYLRTEDRRTIYAAWNLGVQAARGALLTNANTDDRHHPAALERLAAALDARPDVDLVYADTVWTPVENETLQATSSRQRVVWPPFSVTNLRSQCMVGPQPMWRRSVHARHGLFDEAFTSAGDWEFWLRLARDARFLKLDEVLGLYLENQGGAELGNPKARGEAAEVRRRFGVGPEEIVQRARFEAWDAWAVPGRPAASLVVTGLGGLEDLAQACAAAALQVERDLELVVVDPDAGGRTSALLAARAAGLPHRLVRLAAPSVGQAWNAGLEAAAGRFVAPLPPGVIPEPAFLAGCLAALAAQPSAGVAFPLPPAGGLPEAVLCHRALFARGWRFPPVDADGATRALFDRLSAEGARSVRLGHPLTRRPGLAAAAPAATATPAAASRFRVNRSS